MRTKIGIRLRIQSAFCYTTFSPIVDRESGHLYQGRYKKHCCGQGGVSISLYDSTDHVIAQFETSILEATYVVETFDHPLIVSYHNHRRLIFSCDLP